jgi:hypothetical protein
MSKPRLFHSTASARDDDGNYTLYPDRLVPKLNTTHDRSIRDHLVFATSNLLEAPAYAMKGRESDTEIAQLQSSGVFAKIPTAFMYDPEGKFPDQHPNGKIFEVNNETFDLVSKGSEWISRQQVFIKEVQEITPILAMQSGTQFFTYGDINIAQEWRDRRDGLLKKLRPDGDYSEILRLAGTLVEEGKFRFVNRELGLNPLNLSTTSLEDVRFIDDPLSILAATKETWVEKTRKDQTKGKTSAAEKEV